MVSCGYRVKYDRAWRTKQRALKLIYGDWSEACERLSTMLHVMKAKNPDNEDIPCMDTTTSSWSDTKTYFKYGKIVLMFLC
jgi:hypothetical protein